ncbi:hypothetical protein RJT34_05747 [Clitoria ternatea]|uniref:Uncharacterized protein n=1 Tax=Clitoria ternatea TaxID=43366 RepID=A0AAN9K1T4_CLITE
MESESFFITRHCIVVTWFVLMIDMAQETCRIVLRRQRNFPKFEQKELKKPHPHVIIKAEINGSSEDLRAKWGVSSACNKTKSNYSGHL